MLTKTIIERHGGIITFESDLTGTTFNVRLPDGSGFDFCRQIRDLRLTLPIIMLTVPGIGYRLVV